MSDNDLLNGFNATDDHEGGKRTVTVTDGVLTVEFRRDGDDMYYGGAKTKHYRLVEVEQRWVEVSS